MSLNWEEFRRGDGTIDIGEAHKNEDGKAQTKDQKLYLKLVEEYHPIVSRQVAAVALANADMLGCFYQT